VSGNDRKYCYLWLSCSNSEYKIIAKTLLEKRLIACAKFMPVESTYWWEGSMQEDQEMVVVMETTEDLFEEIEVEIAKIHSYKTFVLQQIPVSRINTSAGEWMNNTLKEAS
jgi:periplasmic divalent cation tolerance protein